MCVWQTAHRKNGRKAVNEELDCERNQKFYFKVFFWLGKLFYLVVLPVKNYGDIFFSNFILTFRLVINARLHQKRKTQCGKLTQSESNQK